MRKTLVLLFIAVFVIIQLISFAKTIMSDSGLSAVSGNAGIAINFGNFFIGLTSAGATSWGVQTTGSPFNIFSQGKHLFGGKMPQ